MINQPKFTAEDCDHVIELYLSHRRRKVSPGLISPYESKELLLIELNRSQALFEILKMIHKAPTEKKLKDRIEKIKRPADKLYELLSENTDNYYFFSLVCAKAGKSSVIDIEDDESDRLFHEVFEKTNELGASLKWLIDILNLCLEKDFPYSFVKESDGRTTPETILIQNLSSALTKHFGSGGFTKSAHNKSASGWKIVCIEYLIKHIGVSRSRDQILDAIQSELKKKNS